jgi:crossover junction endodeoxyribonuclease RuvC
VLGIDPGLAATGFGVLEAGPAGLGVVDAGVIETSARLPMDDRLRLIYDGVWGLLDKHGPAALVLEGLYSEYRFPRTALLMAHARGVACLAASQRGVRVMTLAPAEVKRAITGNGAAAKEQIQRGIQRLLHLPALPQPSHVADALALALTGLSRVGRHHMGGGGAIDPIGGGQAPPPRPPLNNRPRRRSRRSNGQ